MRPMTSCVGLLTRLVVPVFLALYYAILNNHRILLQAIKRHVLPAVLLTSRFSLRVVSVGGAFYWSGSKLDLLRTIKLGREALEAMEEPEKSVECEVLHNPSDSSADVIFIHGLKGAMEKTWTQGLWQLTGQEAGKLLRRNTSLPAWLSSIATMDRSKKGAAPYSKCWPRDWLPQDCPHVRVIALNYTTDPYLWRPFWVAKRCRTSMSERSWEMLDQLVQLGVGIKPIIWVGHSKGGLFVKQMLVHACENIEADIARISLATKGILFYSVPHRGSPLANLNLPLFRQSIELTEVQKDSAEVLALHRKFRSLLDTKKLEVDVRSFIETRLTLMSLVYVRIVSEESADAEIGELYGVPLDHRNICKPRSRDCFLYKELLGLIESVCKAHSS